ncbi:MAG: (2Fe-2S)-binding protein [Acidobacteria bacterium]|nr:(2Fe-2S)-binding protein [Acidobacteriota bacterium]
MEEVELKFEGENKSGVAVVGSYLFDAARRLGVDVQAECGRRGECDSCAMKITQGNGFLSAPTFAEIQKLSEQRRKKGERLACQAKLEKAGEIVIMITQKKEENKPETEEKAEEYRKEFEELPLEKKIANLLELEAITLGETFSFVLNSPFKIFDIAMGVMAEFGLNLEEKDKEAKRPKEHQTKKNGNDAKTPPKKTKAKQTTAKNSAKKEKE